MKDWQNLSRTLAFACCAAAVAAFFRLGTPSIDPDSFYHFRYAAIYADKGLLYSQFPWIVYSLIGRYGGDIGYGLHLLLVPFTLLDDPLLGLRLAAVAELTALLLMLYLVLRRHGLVYRALWPFAVVLLSPPMLLVLQMTRPHTLSTGLAVVLVSFLLRGSPWAVLLASFGLAFIHLNISPLVLALALVALAIVRATEKRWDWWKLLAVAGGWLLGWICRPDAIGVAKLEYAQIVTHALARARGLPLDFGLEWLPLDPVREFPRYAAFLLIWLGFALAFLLRDFSPRRLSPDRRSLLWTSFLLSAGFAVLTFANTRRGMTLWSAFSVLFIATAFDSFLVPRLRRQEGGRRVFRALALVTLAAFALPAATAADQIVLKQQWSAQSPDRARLPAQWLQQHTPEGAIVLNVNWWDFASFFFWNTHNRYVGGLDPIFQYAYSPQLFWKVAHIQAADVFPFTCAREVCASGDLEPIHSVMRQDFHADYLILDQEMNPGLDVCLRGSPAFEVCAEDRGLVVYRLRPDT